MGNTAAVKNHASEFQSVVPSAVLAPVQNSGTVVVAGGGENPLKRKLGPTIELEKQAVANTEGNGGTPNRTPATIQTEDRSVSYRSENEFDQTEGQLRREGMADTEFECSQISKYLYVGGIRVAENLELLKEKKITRIINCAASVIPNFFSSEFKYLSLNLIDGRGEDISWFASQVIQFIFDGANQGQKTLLHCEKGISRSCSFAICYRMWSTGEKWKTAFDYVQKRRKICNPHAVFVCNLIEIGEIFGGSAAEATLLFRCSFHAAYDHQTAVLKLCRNLNSRRILVPATSLLNPKGVYVLRAVKGNKHTLFIWKGRFATEATYEKVIVLAEYMMRIFTQASTMIRINEGEEPEEFLSFLVRDGAFHIPDDASASYDDFFDYPPSEEQIEAAQFSLANQRENHYVNQIISSIALRNTAGMTPAAIGGGKTNGELAQRVNNRNISNRSNQPPPSGINQNMNGEVTQPGSRAPSRERSGHRIVGTIVTGTSLVAATNSNSNEQVRDGDSPSIHLPPTLSRKNSYRDEDGNMVINRQEFLDRINTIISTAEVGSTATNSRRYQSPEVEPALFAVNQRRNKANTGMVTDTDPSISQPTAIRGVSSDSPRKENSIQSATLTTNSLENTPAVVPSMVSNPWIPSTSTLSQSLNLAVAQQNSIPMTNTSTVNENLQIHQGNNAISSFIPLNQRVSGPPSINYPSQPSFEATAMTSSSQYNPNQLPHQFPPQNIPIPSLTLPVTLSSASTGQSAPSTNRDFMNYNSAPPTGRDYSQQYVPPGSLFPNQITPNQSRLPTARKESQQQTVNNIALSLPPISARSNGPMEVDRDEGRTPQYYYASQGSNNNINNTSMYYHPTSGNTANNTSIYLNNMHVLNTSNHRKTGYDDINNAVGNGMSTPTESLSRNPSKTKLTPSRPSSADRKSFGVSPRVASRINQERSPRKPSQHYHNATNLAATNGQGNISARGGGVQVPMVVVEPTNTQPFYSSQPTDLMMSNGRNGMSNYSSLQYQTTVPNQQPPVSLSQPQSYYSYPPQQQQQPLQLPQLQSQPLSTSAPSGSHPAPAQKFRKPLLYQLTKRQPSEVSSTTFPDNSNHGRNYEWIWMGIYDDGDLDENEMFLLLCPSGSHHLWIGSHFPYEEAKIEVDSNHRPIMSRLLKWLTKVSPGNVVQEALGAIGFAMLSNDLSIHLSGEETNSFWDAFNDGF